jgi:hypothetical protein
VRYAIMALDRVLEHIDKLDEKDKTELAEKLREVLRRLQ